MADDSTPSAVSRQVSPTNYRRALIWIGLMLAEGAVLFWFIFRLAGGEIMTAGRPWHQLFDMVIIAVGTVAFYRRYQLVSEPLAKLTSLLPQVSSGRAPIDELSSVGGRLAPLAAQIQQILHELRQQRAQHDSDIRQRVANRTSALERAIGSLRQQASRDVLTGLYNRRVFDECMENAMTRAKIGRSNLSLLMIDVDNFKILNDTLGHQAGDDLLRSIGQLIRSAIREGDLAFRWGGDEFAILMENSGPDEARTLGQRLVTLVDGLGKTYRLAKSPGLSIGVANINELTEITTPAMIHVADRALYKLKGERKAIASPSSKPIFRPGASAA